MLTRCPRCETYFRIRATELGRAHGLVQCGNCSSRFDALQHLYDDDGLEVGMPRPLDRDDGLGNTAFDESLANLASDVAAVPPESESPGPKSDKSEHRPPAEFGLASGVVDHGNFDQTTSTPNAETDVDSVIPFVLQAALKAASQRKPSRPMWAIGTAAMLVLLVSQIMWFQHEKIASSVPGGQAIVRGVCKIARCEPARKNDIDKLTLVARDIREHPDFEGALLVNATLVNNAETEQPFPLLQLDLNDHNGQPVAARRFQPAEYLDQSVLAQEDMPPKVPVHITLEILEPTIKPRGFEFHFL